MVNYVSLLFYLLRVPRRDVFLLLNFDFLGNKRGDNQQTLSDKQPQKMVDKMHSMVLLQNQYALSSLGPCLLSQRTDSSPTFCM